MTMMWAIKGRETGRGNGATPNQHQEDDDDDDDILDMSSLNSPISCGLVHIKKGVYFIPFCAYFADRCTSADNGTLPLHRPAHKHLATSIPTSTFSPVDRRMGFSQARKTLSTMKDGMDVQATFEGLLHGGGGGNEETYHLPPPQSGRYPIFYWYPDHSQPEALHSPSTTAVWYWIFLGEDQRNTRRGAYLIVQVLSPQILDALVEKLPQLESLKVIFFGFEKQRQHRCPEMDW